MKKLFPRLASAALGLLGFSACDIIGFGVAMYGEPHADFKVLGTVKDQDGHPIEGIRVAIKQDYGNEKYDPKDTLTTDGKGKYELIGKGPWHPNGVTVVFEDIDGELNGGEFESASTNPEIVKTKDGDKKWYEGAFEARADVTLKKK